MKASVHLFFRLAQRTDSGETGKERHARITQAARSPYMRIARVQFSR